MEHGLSMPDESLNQTNLKCFVADKIAMAVGKICRFLQAKYGGFKPVNWTG